MITVDSTSFNSMQDSAPNLTWTHTVGAGQNKILVVAVSQRNSTISSVTYGGTALTFSVASPTVEGANVRFYYLLRPPVGSANVVVTFSAPGTRASAGAISLFNVDYDNPVHETNTNNGVGTAVSTSYSIDLDTALVIDGIFHVADSGSVSNSQTSIYTSQTNDIGGMSYKENQTGAGSMSWTVGTSDSWTSANMVLKPSAVNGASLLGLI